MGMFDLRCAVSGIPTTFARSDAGTELSCSMVMLEQVEGQWLPFSPPVRGAYDSYGALDFWPEHHSDHLSAVIHPR